MQTFLPLPDFRLSAMCLDRQRLGKQRLEAHQIYNSTVLRAGGWINHPAVRMWRDHRGALGLYLDAIVEEWEARGYRNTIRVLHQFDDHTMPPWLGDPALHASHRAALLHKDPEHYSEFGWPEEPALDYVWPV